MSDWKEMKKAHYKTNILVLSEHGAIDFSPDSLQDVVGAEMLSYDEYLDVQWNSLERARHSFEHCYYEMPMNFKGRIEIKNKTKVCYEKIYVEGMRGDGIFFEGKENHVWMDLQGFENYEVGDALSFSAEVYKYLKTGNGKAIDFGLRNPYDITKIDDYELPSDEVLTIQAIEQIVCETCPLTYQCYGLCMLPEGERKRRIDMIAKLK